VAHYDARLAGARDYGVRKVGRLTWRAGAIGAAVSAVFGLVLAHPEAKPTPHHQSGEVIIPGQPPKPASGGGLVTSGAS
jgi:hypothetical protein